MLQVSSIWALRTRRRRGRRRRRTRRERHWAGSRREESEEGGSRGETTGLLLDSPGPLVQTLPGPGPLVPQATAQLH